ncbi:MAG TPA: PorV/PorQ family protein [Bacteroidota bacterium]
MKRTYLIPLIAVLLLALGATLVDAQTQKAGLNSAAFLKVGVGARQAALGSAVTSMDEDVTNMFWNPAGVALKEQSAQASFTYNNWIGGLSQEAAAVSYKWADIGTIGIGFQSFGISGIAADRDNGYSDSQLQALVTDQVNSSTYDYQDLLIQATYSRYITDYLALGASVKYIHEKIDDVGAGTIGFDLGTVYNIGLLGWSIGARVNNLGGDLKFIDFASPIPLTFSIGTSVVPVDQGITRWMLALDIVKPQDGTQYYYAGTELGFNKTFFVRAGWKFNYSWFGLNGNGIDAGTTYRAPIQTSLERGSFGAGVRVPFDTYVINVDYAYTVFSALQDVHRFTISFAMK